MALYSTRVNVVKTIHGYVVFFFAISKKCGRIDLIVAKYNVGDCGGYNGRL